MATEDDRVNTRGLVAIAIAFTSLTLILAFGLMALVRDRVHDREAEEGMSADLGPVRQLAHSQQATLHSGKVSIERAEKLVIDAIRQDAAAATPTLDAGADAPDASPDGSDASTDRR